MTSPPADRFAHDDAAYVLGALPEAERAEFEAHLAGCADCRARVDEVRGLPALLAGVHPDEVADDLADDLPPDSLLPGLVRRAERQRRRQRGLVAGLGLVAAACVAALVVALWPATGSAGPPPRALHALVHLPLRAEAQLIASSWGTEIRLHCRYDTLVEQGYAYRLVVVDRSGHREVLGSWELPPGKAIDYTAGTALRAAQIRQVQITLPDGRPIMQLTT